MSDNLNSLPHIYGIGACNIIVVCVYGMALTDTGTPSTGKKRDLLCVLGAASNSPKPIDTS